MTASRDLDEILAAWLEEGPTRLPDQTRRAIAVAIPTSQRRHRPEVPWRSYDVSSTLKLLIGAAAVVAVVLGGMVMFGSGTSGPGGVAPPRGSPSPAGEPSASPPASADALTPIDTAAWTDYVSERYGFTMAYPVGWTATPAITDWTMQADGKDWLSRAADQFRSPGADVLVTAWSVPLAEGTTIDDGPGLQTWVEDYCRQTANAPCGNIQTRAEPLCNERRDCHPGLLVPFNGDVQAFFTGGNYSGRVIIVAVWWEESAEATRGYGGSSHLLEAFLSTMGISTLGIAPPTLGATASPSR